MSAAARGRGLRPGGVARALFRLVLFVVLGFGVGLVFGLVTEEPDLLAGHLSGEGREVALEDGDHGASRSEAATEGIAGDAGSPGASAIADAAATSGARPAAETDRPRAATPETRAELPRVAAARRVASAESETDARSGMPAVEAPAPAARRRAAASRPVAAIGPVPELARVPARSPSGWAIQVGAFSDPRAAERLAEGLRGRYPVDVLPAREEGGRWRVRVQPIDDEVRARALADRLKRDERLPTWVTRMEARPGS